MIEVPSSDAEYRELVIDPIVKAVADSMEGTYGDESPVDPMVLTRAEDRVADRAFGDDALKLAAVYQNGLLNESFTEAIEAVMEHVHEAALEELERRGLDVSQLA